MYPQGGFKTVTPLFLANCFDALATRRISYRGFRILFACLAAVAAREAAARVVLRKGRKMRAPRFSVPELADLAGLSLTITRTELRRLSRAGIIVIRQTDICFFATEVSVPELLLADLAGKRASDRPIPFPRSAIRFVSRCSKRSLALTAIAYLARGVSISRNGGEITAAGSVKAAWLARVTGLSIRSVKAARKELIAAGFITKDRGSVQRKLNRHGAYFVVNLKWKGMLSIPDRRTTGVASRSATPSVFAPPSVEKPVSFAPPLKDRKTLFRSKNQKAGSGVCSETQQRPKLSDIRIEDLERVSRTLDLYRQAVRRGWLADSDANRLNWFAAAIRARTTAARDPVRVFVSIVKRQAWQLITSGHEARALAVLKRIQVLGQGSVPQPIASSGRRGESARVSGLAPIRVLIGQFLAGNGSRNFHAVLADPLPTGFTTVR